MSLGPFRVVSRIATKPQKACHTGLTAKDEQTIALVSQGMRNKAIAAEMGIKEQVVKNRMRTIYLKLGVDSRIGLVLWDYTRKNKQFVGL